MEMDNDSFEALLQQIESTPLQKITPGSKVSATIVGIDGETLFIDIGAKSEGIVEASEFTDEQGALTVGVGDRVEVYCLRPSPTGTLCTARIGGSAGGAHFEEAWRNGVPVEGFVKAEVKGGFEITLSGNVRAFCPYSQMGLRRVENAAEQYLETRLSFLITRFEPDSRNIVLSARALQEEERRLKKEALQQELKEGQSVHGTVSSIRPFGMFVDIGGVDGLVPISEISWSRIEHIEQSYRMGQSVTAIVKSLDWENDRISLSIKETLEDPWEMAAMNFQEGTRHIGTIARLAPFGAFVTLTPGVDGLIHVSKLGQGRKINHPKEVVEAGQQIEVVVESVEREHRRIALAPTDYTSAEETAEKQFREFKHHRSARTQAAQDHTMGSFGALLKKKLQENKK